MTTINRDRSLDMAKGLLIAMLVFHHIVDVGYRMNRIDNEVLRFMFNIQKPLITCYFMPAFFIISGMVSNFKRPFRPFIYNQFKTLLIPAISFTVIFHPFFWGGYSSIHYDLLELFEKGGMFWFLIALFFAKCIFYIMRKLFSKDYLLIITLLILSIIGTIINQYDIFPNYLMNRHVLDLTLFLGLGHIFKEKIKTIRWGGYCAVIYFSFLSLYYLTNHDIPYVTGWFGSYITNWPFHIVLSITGTVTIIDICRLLPVNSLTEYCGRNSLVVYLMQFYVLLTFFEAFGPLFSENLITPSIFYILMIFISTMSIGLFTAYILNNTPLKILIGKF